MLVAVVRTKINTCFDAVFFTGIYKFAHNIAFPAFPSGVLYAVVCIFARPKAKAIGMFGREDGCRYAG